MKKLIIKLLIVIILYTISMILAYSTDNMIMWIGVILIITANNIEKNLR